MRAGFFSYFLLEGVFIRFEGLVTGSLLSSVFLSQMKTKPCSNSKCEVIITNRH